MQVSVVNLKVKQESQKNKQRNQRRSKPPQFVAAIAVIVIVLVSLVWLFVHGTRQQDANITYIEGIPVISNFLPENSASRPGNKRTIQYVVIHETDNFKAGADAAAHNTFLINGADTQELSWHYTVDDHEIYHNLPDDEVAYHASDHLNPNGGNRNGIGVELCVNEDGDYETTLENASVLTATLLKEYGLSLSSVKKHQDFSGKICPARLIHDGRWDSFLEHVQEKYNELQDSAE